MEYYDGRLRDGYSNRVAAASDKVGLLDERRKDLAQTNPLLAEDSLLPPEPSVEEVTYENLSINLQAIAKNALEELNDLKNEDASKETSAEPQPKDEAANAVLSEIVESLQEHLAQQDDQPKEEEE